MSDTLEFPALDPMTVEVRQGIPYPGGLAEPCKGRVWRKLGDALGLTQFGVNLTTLAPGAWSARRHWHERPDEFVYVVSGTLTLVTDAGEQVLETGMAAGFPGGAADAHHLVNNSDTDATFLEFGTRIADDETHYPDDDLHLVKRAGEISFRAKDGTPY